MTLGALLGLFPPLFFVIEMLSAAPGRPSMQDVLRRGARNFGRHLVLFVAFSLAFHWVTGFFLNRPPLW